MHRHPQGLRLFAIDFQKELRHIGMISREYAAQSGLFVRRGYNFIRYLLKSVQSGVPAVFDFQLEPARIP